MRQFALVFVLFSGLISSAQNEIKLSDLIEPLESDLQFGINVGFGQNKFTVADIHIGSKEGAFKLHFGTSFIFGLIVKGY